MYPEKKGGSHKMARPQQNWGLLTLLTRWASIWTMPNTASPKSEPPCGRAVYTPVRATILGHPPQKTAPGGKNRVYHTETIHIFINFSVPRWYVSWWLYHNISRYMANRFTPTFRHLKMGDITPLTMTQQFDDFCVCVCVCVGGGGIFRSLIAQKSWYNTQRMSIPEVKHRP